MTIWAEELKILRRYLRDPDGRIWGGDVILDAYNETQDDLQRRLGLYHTVRVMPSPPRWQISYLHDWEWEFRAVPGRAVWWALRHHGQGATYCAPFEDQALVGYDAAESEYGTAAVIHPWEAWYALPGAPVPYPWPDDLTELRAIWHDEEPVHYIERRRLGVEDSGYTYREGSAQAWWRDDATSPAYYLYPRPSTDGANYLSGEGPVQYVGGDTLGSEYGVTTLRTTGATDGETGIAVDVVDAADNVLMVYEARPRQVATPGDLLDWPDWALRYVRYGTLERLYRVQGDGQIESLALYWGSRYELGLEALKRYARMRHEDRDYRLATKGVEPSGARRRGPRLPPEYPPI
jgi:hypothetical protein